MESEAIRCRTVLIEGENLIRGMLARLLLLSDRFHLLADFGEIAPVRNACLRLLPELIIIGIDFAPEESVGLIELLARELPITRVVALSTSKDPALLHRLHRAQVHGYVSRAEPLEFFEEAIREVAVGRTYLPAAFLKSQQEFASRREEAAAGLTQREQEILRRVASGRTSRQIASDLQRSPRSIETYRSRILRKLNLPNTAALVEFAFRHGMLRRATVSRGGES